MTLTRRVLTLIITICLFTKAHAQVTHVTISGSILDSVSNKPIAAATISLDKQVSHVSDSNGHFSFNTYAGSHVLRVSAVSYFHKVIRFNNRNDTAISIYLPNDFFQMQDIVISAKKEDANVNTVQMGQVQVNMAQLKKAPLVLGEADIFRSLLLQPGVTSVGEGAAGYNVRGGNVDQNLVLLDGAPLFNTFHLLGFFSAINPDLVQSATLFKGNIPAEYGGRVSSLLLMNTKTGNLTRPTLSGSINPFSIHLNASAPIIKDKLSISGGARVAFPDYILRFFQANIRNSSAFFYDANLKLNYKISNNHNIAISGYHSYDRFNFPGDTLYSWNSSTASFLYSGKLANRLNASVSAVYSVNHAENHAQDKNFEYKLNTSVKYKEAKAQIWYTKNSNFEIRGGASTGRYDIQPGDFGPDAPNSNVGYINIQREYGRESAAFLSSTWEPLNGFAFEAGIRYSSYQYLGPSWQYQYDESRPKSKETITDSTYYSKDQVIKSYGGWEPRVSLKINITPNSSVKLSYNRSYQYIQLISNTTAVTPIDFWKLSDNYIQPAKADQYVLGLFANFMDNMFTSSIEGFYKLTKNVVEYKDGAKLLVNPYLNADLVRADGRAYGVELSVQKVKGKWTGQFSYTYSRALVQTKGDFPDEQVNKGKEYPSNFDRPHNLSVTLTKQMKYGWSFQANIVYASGRPITYPDGRYIFNATPAVVNYGDRNAERVPNYNRLDVSFSKDTRKTPTQRRYSVWNISLYNVFMHKNPYSIYFVNTPYGVHGYRLSVIGSVIPSLTYNFFF